MRQVTELATGRIPPAGHTSSLCSSFKIRHRRFTIITTMKTRTSIWHFLTVAALAASTLHSVTFAQPTNRPGRGFGPMGPQVVSPEVSADRKISFRILAPKAESVRLSAGDIPGLRQGP